MQLIPAKMPTAAPRFRQHGAVPLFLAAVFGCTSRGPILSFVGDSDVAECTPACVAGAWIVIAPGAFLEGTPASERGHQDDETLHQVVLTHRFALQESDVTQGDFQGLMGINPSYFGPYGAGGDCGSECPVESVSWFDAVAYANELSRQQGLSPCYSLADVECRAGGAVGAQVMRCYDGDASTGGVVSASVSVLGSIYDCTGYRLPTEAEFEFAARAGSVTATYNGDLDPGALVCEGNSTIEPIAWYCGNITYGPEPVKTKLPNAWGLYDILGNVWKWCHDEYLPYPTTVVTDPGAVGTIVGDRNARGGCWGNGAHFLRSGRRGWGPPGDVSICTGFRVARSVDASTP